MFFRVSNASKVALVHLVRQMQVGGYIVLDTQYTNPHLEQFSVVEIPQEDYQERLRNALCVSPTCWSFSAAETASRAPDCGKQPYSAVAVQNALSGALVTVVAYKPYSDRSVEEHRENV